MRISAVVPVYNSQRYVARCIESVLAQTYQNWELILVDDGSKDSSLSILLAYESKDPRIMVIHQENTGPGMARNTGIRKATGEYIVFVDSDDRIKPTYFQRLSAETADVVFIDIDQVSESLHVLRQEHMSNYQLLSKDDFLRCQMTGKILWGGVRKAVKAELLLKNKIEFTRHKVGEEAIYSFLLLHYSTSVAFISGSVYEYVRRAGSQSNTTGIDPWGGVAAALKERVRQMGLYETYADTLNAFFATAAVVSLAKTAEKYDYKTYREKAKKRMKKYWEEVDSNFPVDFAHMSSKAIIMFLFLKVGWVTPVYGASLAKRAKDRKEIK